MGSRELKFRMSRRARERAVDRPERATATLADRAVRGVGFTLGAQVLRALTQVASVVVLSRLLPSADFGILAMITAIVGIATVLGDFGLSTAAIQAKTITNAQRSNLFWANAAIGVLVAGLLLALAGVIGGFYREPSIDPLVRVLALTFVINAFTTQYRAELTRELRFHVLAAVDTVAPVVALLLAIVLSIAGFGAWALVWQQVAIALVTLVGCAAGTKWSPGWPTRAPMRSLVRFGLGALGVQIVTYLSTNVDNVILGRFAGAAETGYYARAFQLYRLPAQQIATPIGQVALPVLSRLQHDQQKFEAYFERAHLAMLYVFGGASFAMAACSWPIVDVALGSGWGPAKPLFLVLAIGGVFQSMTYAYMWAFQSKGLVGLQLRYAVIGRSIMIGLLFAGLPFGALGVAAGSAAGQLVMWSIYTVFAVERFGFSRARIVRLVAAPFAIGTIAAVVAGAVSVVSGGLVPALHLAVAVLAFAVAWLASGYAIPSARRTLKELWRTGLRLFTSRTAS